MRMRMCIPDVFDMRSDYFPTPNRLSQIVYWLAGLPGMRSEACFKIIPSGTRLCTEVQVNEKKRREWSSSWFPSEAVSFPKKVAFFRRRRAQATPLPATLRLSCQVLRHPLYGGHRHRHRPCALAPLCRRLKSKGREGNPL